MLRVGLSGGIGSGKSTVSRRLVERGAVVVDSDVIAREVVAVGTPGLAQVVERFGESVLAEDGSLDRPALAATVFGDDDARAALNGIVHPLVFVETVRQIEAAPADAVVVHDIPLLVELGREVDYHLVVIVDTPADERLRRLVADRGMTAAEAQARIDAQATDEQRHAAADVMLPNTGSVDDLLGAVDLLWDNRIQPYAINLREGRRTRRPAAVALVAYDDRWPTTAARLAGRITTQLRNNGLAEALVAVDHVGSTSVPGLRAKPVIDLQVRVDDLAVVGAMPFEKALLAAGFVGRRGPEIDTVHAFAPDEADWAKVFYGGADPDRVVNLHVREADSAGATSALLFRDWLRAHPDERDAYAALKVEVAAGHPGATPESGEDYTVAKEPWIASALLRARSWATATSWEPDRPSR
ncbi:dephospho-CoA kinase [Luteipulveratus halotolerans]|uniref:Dephospho-CoA kinase n=1 Tax=Luteipulveratus halotolerans TaxID=1631356 RepID=A0A0L6CHP8_9MICO|nr:dephospho-CoA kinase [Luteipulveratus halotolerans]KNX37244.1 hypothetical protein VV01_08945 [Luteipulveratus halotolerans]